MTLSGPSKTTWSDLPPLTLELLVSHHLDSLDIRALAATCRAMRSLMCSHALQAAWLWKRKGDLAIWEALRCCTDAVQRLSVVRQLVEVHHADVGVEMDGKTVLHRACGDGHVDVVNYLSTQPNIRINVATSDNLGVPLHFACFNGHVDVVRQLLGHTDIQVNLADQDGLMPLHLSCQEGHVDVVRELLGHTDIQVNLASQGGWMPLHVACREGHVDVVRLLLGHTDIQVDLADQGGKTPLQMASFLGHADVVHLLRSR